MFYEYVKRDKRIIQHKWSVARSPECQKRFSQFINGSLKLHNAQKFGGSSETDEEFLRSIIEIDLIDLKQTLDEIVEKQAVKKKISFACY